MFRKIGIMLLIFMIVFVYTSAAYFQAKADVLVLSAAGLSFMSGVGEILIAAGLVGIAGYMTYKTISSIMSRRMNAAYNSMTSFERANFDSKVSSWDGTSDVTLSFDELRSIGGEKILNSMVSEIQAYTPVEVPDTETEIVAVPQIGDFPANNVVVSKDLFIHTDNASDAVKSMCNKDIPLQIFIEYNTVGVDFAGGNYVYPYEYTNYGGLATLIRYNVLDYRTGHNYFVEFALLISDYLVGGRCDQYLEFGNVLVLNSYLYTTRRDFTSNPSSLTQKAQLIADGINSALGVNLLTGQDVFPTIPLIGNGSIEYSPPIADVTTVSLPQEITLTGDPGVIDGNRDVIPLIPPTILDNNPDIKTSLEQGENTSNMTNELSPSTSEPGEETGDMTGVIDSIGDLIDVVNRFFDLSKPINLNPLKLSGELFITKFPFSLPWDLLHAMQIFNTEGQRPDLNIHVSDSLLGTWDMNIDMTIFEPYLNIIKQIELILFTVGLVLITPKIVGGDK